MGLRAVWLATIPDTGRRRPIILSRILAGASSVIRPPPADQQARQRRDFRHGMHDGKRDPPRIPGGSNKKQQDANSSEVATPSLFSGRCPTVRWVAWFLH